MDDSRLELGDEKGVDRVDVLAAPGAKTEVVKTRSVLVEGAAVRAARRSAYEDACAVAMQ
jgi:hypothetical protein